MRAFALLILLISITGLAQADRHALLVAIDSYPIVQGRQLSGSAYDLHMMGKMLEYYNFQTDQLAGPNATRQAIITKLATLAKTVAAGDEFVFYFSGRGSIAPPVDKPESKVQMEPTLVPYDGKESVTDFDLRMKRIEDWAQEITTKGGNVTIIVDASFQFAARDDVGRPYNPMPRSIRRKSTMDGEARDEPYLGPGTYIAATPTGGSAYEYLVNTSKNIWDGAFTDMLVGEVIGELHKGMVPTYTGVMREVQAFFKDKVRQDYMPGLSPYPPPKMLLAKSDIYGRAMFGGIKPGDIPPKQQVDIQQSDDQRKERQSKLRIGLSFPSVRGRSNTDERPRDADDMEKDRDPQLVDAVTKYVGGKFLGVEVEPVGAPVDMILTLVKQPGGGIEASVKGNDVDEIRDLRFSGTDAAALMKAGLSDHIERQALTLKLFRLLEDQKPTWNIDAVVTADKDTYQPNENFTITFNCQKPALLYVFNRNDADGIIQIVLPAEGALDNSLSAGPHPLTGTILRNSPAGKMLVRCLYLDPKSAKSMPRIGANALAGLLAQLRILVPGVESHKLRWTTKEISLTVQP